MGRKTKSLWIPLTEALVNLSLEATPAQITSFLDFYNLCKSPLAGFYNDPAIIRLKKMSSAYNFKDFYIDNSRLYVLSKAAKQQLQMTLEEKNSASQPHIFSPEDEEFEDICKEVRSQQKTLQAFLEYCREEQTLNEFFLNQVFLRMKNLLPLGLEIKNFQGCIKNSNIPMQYPSLQDELEGKIYITPLLQGGAKQWIKNRLCNECGRIYFYKLDRAKFCSEACRIRRVRRS